MYDDRLDGRTTSEDYSSKVASKTDDRNSVVKNMEKLNDNNSECAERGIDILECTQNDGEVDDVLFSGVKIIAILSIIIIAWR